jgi:V8-like Glu-specific endopeptidase
MKVTSLCSVLFAVAAATGCVGCVDGEAPASSWRKLSSTEAARVGEDIQIANPGNAAFHVGPEGVLRSDVQPEFLGDVLQSPASETGTPDRSEAGRADLIFGADDRVPYTATSTLTSFNKRTIGKLRISHGSLGSFECTGSMIGPRHVLTSAHCLIHPTTGTLPAYTAMTFTPGERGVGFGDTSPNPAPYADGRHRSNGYYLRSNNDVWDYALVILEDKAQTAGIGYMGLWWNSDDDWYEGRWMSTVGYPGGSQVCANAPASTAPTCGNFQYGQQCIIDTADEDLEFECDVTKGQSGSPVYTWMDGNPLVIGVVRGSTSTPFSDWNKGVRFNATKIGDLCDWIEAQQSAFNPGYSPCN